MAKSNKRIEIVSSSVVELSAMSKASRESALKVLSRHYKDVRITIVNNLSDLEALVDRKPDLVFIGMKFVPRNPNLGTHDPAKVWLADYLDEHKIAYTGSKRRA